MGVLTMETYNGMVRTPSDAIILFEACRIGLLPRVQRRLSEKERQSIKSGSIFVWDEREAGMRRWTDGKSWSASRVSGSFLTYREMEGKRGGSSYDKDTSSYDKDAGGYEKDTVRESSQPQANDAPNMLDGPEGYRYKRDGLIKQSFSITTNQGQHLHLISYYSRSNSMPSLLQPTNDPQLRHIRPEKGMYPESTVHEQSNIPPVTRGPMGSPGYAHSPHHTSPYARGAPYPYHHWAPPNSMPTPPPHDYPPYYHHPHPHSGYPPYPPPYYSAHGYGAPPQPTAFDRVPPPMSNNGLPPPPPPPPPPGSQAQQPPQHPHHQYGPPSSYQHSYPGGYSYPPPPPQHHSSSLPPPADQPYSRPEAHPERAHARSHSSHSHEDRKPPPRQDSHPSAPPPAPQPKPSEQAQTQAPPPPPPPPPATSSGQTIPSISAMLNGPVAPPPPRPTSRTPPGSSRPLQDIPSYKLGFEASRDVQALRNLDKTTFKGY